MNKSRGIFIVVFLFLICLMSGCGKKELQAEDVISELKEIGAYSCDIAIHNKNSKQTVTYNCKQYYNSQFGHRLEIDDERILIFKGNDISINDLNNGAFYSTDDDFDSVFKLSFVEEYIGLLYTDEEIKYVFENEEGKNIMLIYLNIPGSNRNLNKAVMYVDADEVVPIKTIIYDFQDKEKIQFVYENFQKSEDVGEERFQTK
ncbi:germination lipoprotein GerS-related protein [Clostridium grantii]|uniref:Outer membrane lipoprotein-sorting protein n=1 Tax=Clostridium grantii DSM 8605 TaxID=1121316 RepID=A0A1M5U4S2_9CLOT|nr:germination lipoprotein GerS-related protein [Clostridium grantii]SHH57861.1 Outer membrane lipoprotein-sorting protein [Clostridium grantii DSM 8605]